MKSVLNESQIEQIADMVNGSNITSAELKEDLIDHLCCVVEDEMSKGKSFETASREALQRVCPNGLNEIQTETVFLLTSKRRKKLNRMIFVSGFVSLSGLLITIVLKLLHLPFSSIFLVLSNLVLVFLFFPFIIVRLVENIPGKRNIVIFAFGFIGAWSFALSGIFAVYHWPGTLYMLLSGVLNILIAFSIFFFKIFKKSR